MLICSLSPSLFELSQPINAAILYFLFRCMNKDISDHFRIKHTQVIKI